MAHEHSHPRKGRDNAILPSGRFVGAGVNFLLGAAVLHTHTLGLPVALTAVAFVIGLFVIPLAPETRGEALPQ